MYLRFRGGRLSSRESRVGGWLPGGRWRSRVSRPLPAGPGLVAPDSPSSRKSTTSPPLPAGIPLRPRCSTVARCGWAGRTRQQQARFQNRHSRRHVVSPAIRDTPPSWPRRQGWRAMTGPGSLAPRRTPRRTRRRPSIAGRARSDFRKGYGRRCGMSLARCPSCLRLSAWRTGPRLNSPRFVRATSARK